MLLLSRFKISGHSMEPTLKNNAIVLASSIPHFFSKPLVGDIVVFKDHEKIFIKRIVQRKGNQYFLAGDNKHDSFDSRRIGWISRKNIVGKVIYKLT